MSPKEGAHRLMFHAGECVEGAFLFMLRPYRGVVDEAILSDVMRALRACGPILTEKKRLERELVSALWAISSAGRLWALEADGMLRRNDLITPEDHAKISRFLADFDLAVMMLLEGEDVLEESCFTPYHA